MLFKEDWLVKVDCLVVEDWLLAGLQDSSLTVWWGVSWKRFGDRMAGAKNLRKMKLLTAVYLTSRSSVSRWNTQSGTEAMVSRF